MRVIRYRLRQRALPARQSPPVAQRSQRIVFATETSQRSFQPSRVVAIMAGRIGTPVDESCGIAPRQPRSVEELLEASIELSLLREDWVRRPIPRSIPGVSCQFGEYRARNVQAWRLRVNSCLRRIQPREQRGVWAGAVQLAVKYARSNRNPGSQLKYSSK